MLQKIDSAALASVFAVGLLIIAAVAAYGGRLLPEYPMTGSDYDKSGYVVELGIWLVTLLSGALLAVKTLARRKK